jgi:mannitol-1-phosphate/altronate dehydrogenase
MRKRDIRFANFYIKPELLRVALNMRGRVPHSNRHIVPDIEMREALSMRKLSFLSFANTA